MLVSKRQEWYEFEEQTAPPAKAPQAQPKKVAKNRCLTVLIFLAALAMFVAMQSSTIVGSGYELVQMKAQVARIEKENEQLRLDIAKLKSPQRIQQIATSQLGMVKPQGVYLAAEAKTTSTITTQPEQTLAQSISIFRTNKAEASKGR